ncbi:hypothetical protein EWB00_010511 [Schistosoma japonicum]|uniref:Uncharacterized protein n=1 Tax=Schistosoma japonicum TaxID=6182 RepID=A0A4Z2DYY4_SCHJA|nr:hypothetical protein EWB00_010511 [Schistosoma japonicum]
MPKPSLRISHHETVVFIQYCLIETAAYPLPSEVAFEGEVAQCVSISAVLRLILAPVVTLKLLTALVSVSALCSTLGITEDESFYSSVPVNFIWGH